MKLLDLIPCLFCLNLATARLGLDKKGRPFVHCVGCGARSFLPSFSPCLNGLALLTPWLRAVVDEMAAGGAGFEKHHRTIAAFMSELKAQHDLGASSSGNAASAPSTALSTAIANSNK